MMGEVQLSIKMTFLYCCLLCDSSSLNSGGCRMGQMCLCMLHSILKPVHVTKELVLYHQVCNHPYGTAHKVPMGLEPNSCKGSLDDIIEFGVTLALVAAKSVQARFINLASTVFANVINIYIQ